MRVGEGEDKGAGGGTAVRVRVFKRDCSKSIYYPEIGKSILSFNVSQ